MSGERERNGKTSLLAGVVISILLIGATIVGAGVGLVLAGTVNVMNTEEFETFTSALPSKILDINGDIITEFSSAEKRELVPLDELPRHLILAVIAREDQDFYRHRGFSIKGIARAAFGVLTKRNLGGGSTITQQVAGTLYADRSDKTLARKIRELWWAIQIERRYSKNEILELYLNKMYMGAGTYGVEAASKYYFGHTAREISIAEAAILVIQFSSPARYNPLDNPNVARNRQQEVLKRMVSLGYVTQEDADVSFQDYWDNYDYTRVSSSAFLSRQDEAPWFSEYVRRELSGMLYGASDLYRDGFTVHTTLDLKMQRAADKYMARGLRRVNAEFKRTQTVNLGQAASEYLPVIELLSLVYDINAIHASTEGQMESKAYNRYIKRINPVVDVMSLLFDLGDLKTATNMAHSTLRKSTEQSMVEGALVTIENESGHIKALVGGSKYDQSNQLIRATQAKVMPGSSFKPFYYSAAIDSGKFTATSVLYDSPIVFFNKDGTPYVPNNYGGVWKGPVQFWLALAMSYNIPALKVLDGIGFDQAISRSAALLGITDKQEIARTFPRVYPLALGIIAVSPLQMARAYAIFGNQGREVTPIAIRSVEDRNGQVTLDPEKELRLQQRKRKDDMQIISPQNAYIMNAILKKTVDTGLMAYATARGTKFDYIDNNGQKIKIEAAGKTGTTQNWADAWAIGYTPYYTTAVWFGFDRSGNSLGTSQTGSMIAAPVWADYMRDIHEGHYSRSFPKPAKGIIDVTVCRRSGLLMTEHCNEGAVTMPFLYGTQPTRYCDLHGESEVLPTVLLDSMSRGSFMIDTEDLDIEMPVLDLGFLDGEDSTEDAFADEFGDDYLDSLFAPAETGDDYYSDLFGPSASWPSFNVPDAPEDAALPDENTDGVAPLYSVPELEGPQWSDPSEDIPATPLPTEAPPDFDALFGDEGGSSPDDREEEGSGEDMLSDDQNTFPGEPAPPAEGAGLFGGGGATSESVNPDAGDDAVQEESVGTKADTESERSDVL